MSNKRGQDTVSKASTASQPQPKRMKTLKRCDLQCAICHELLCVPVTLGCSHSFCQTCINNYFEVLRNNKMVCPSCRRGNYRLKDLSVNQIFSEIISKSYPNEMKKRIENHNREVALTKTVSAFLKSEEFKNLKEALNEMIEDTTWNLNDIYEVFCTNNNLDCEDLNTFLVVYYIWMVLINEDSDPDECFVRSYGPYRIPEDLYDLDMTELSSIDIEILAYLGLMSQTSNGHDMIKERIRSLATFPVPIEEIMLKIDIWNASSLSVIKAVHSRDEN